MNIAEVIAQWATEWEPKLIHLYDEDMAAKDPSYSENWLIVEATVEANEDLNRRLGITPSK